MACGEISDDIISLSLLLIPGLVLIAGARRARTSPFERFNFAHLVLIVIYHTSISGPPGDDFSESIYTKNVYFPSHRRLFVELGELCSCWR